MTRAKGEGSIYQRKGDGRWVRKYHYIDENGTKQTKLLYAATQSKAIEKLEIFKKYSEDMKNISDEKEPEDITLEHFIKTIWFPHLDDAGRAGEYKRRTLVNYKSITENHIIPNFGDFLLNDIRAKHIINGLRKMKNEMVLDHKTDKMVRKYSDTTIKDTQRRLSIIFQHAIEQEYIPDNPTIAVRNNAVLKIGRKKEHQILTAEQYHRVLEFLQEPVIDGKPNTEIHYYEPIHTLFHTGGRRNEILGLRWCDIDRISGNAIIAQQVDVLPGGTVVFDAPKSESSMREIALTFDNIQVLNEYYDKQSYYKLDKNGKQIKNKSGGYVISTPPLEDLIFRRLDGSYNTVGAFILPATLTHAWVRITRKLNKIFAAEREAGISNIPPLRDEIGKVKIRLHDIRHTHASVLYENDALALDISRRLGHSNVATTQNIYTTLSDKRKRETANRAEDALKKR